MLLCYPVKFEPLKNVIFQWQWDITTEDCTKCIVQLHQNGPVHYKICVVMQQCMYKTKIYDISDLQKRLMQTWFDFEQNVIDAAIDQWRNRSRSCVHAGGGHFEHML